MRGPLEANRRSLPRSCGARIDRLPHARRPRRRADRLGERRLATWRALAPRS